MKTIERRETMVLILEGISEKGAHARSSLCYFTFLRHLRRQQRAVTNRTLFFSKNTYFPSCSELPSNVSTMREPEFQSKLSVPGRSEDPNPGIFVQVEPAPMLQSKWVFLSITAFSQSHDVHKFESISGRKQILSITAFNSEIEDVQKVL